MAMPWANARVAHLLLVCRMTAIKVGGEIAEKPSSDDYDEVVYTQNTETIEAFFIPHGTGESRMGPHQRAYQHHDPGIMDQRWLFATGPYYTEYLHGFETR